MVFCCLFSGDPIDTDPRKNNGQTFKVNMLNAPLKDPGCCILSCFCPICAQYILRKKALRGDMTRYICCQGYFDKTLPCVKSGSCGESSCPNCCLGLESCFCNSCAVSSTRMLVMDEHNIQPDPWDNRIIRCNNCLQLLSCCCNLLSICIEELKDCASVLQCIANCTYYTTQGCMAAQINIQLKEDITEEYHKPPKTQVMNRV